MGDVLFHSGSQRGKVENQRETIVELPLISFREEYNHCGDLKGVS